ncbi:MAG: phosphate acyltransferase [Solirubrobacteraceae bacterium]
MTSSAPGARDGSADTTGGHDADADAVIAVDCNGADLGPAEVAAGAAIAAGEGARTILFGPALELRQAVRDAPVDMIELVDAPVSIAKHADPVSAARAHPDASIVQAARAVSDGRAQALVCAGGTGAALAAGLFNIKRAHGIHRPALALPLPVPGRPVTLLDVGASAQARPEHLEQFAFMGAALAQTVLGVAHPRVGLLSNGEEAERGSPLVVETHARLRARIETTATGAGVGAETGACVDMGAFELVGNVEGGDLVSGVADVIVTDGLTGNIALKTMEGVSQTLLHAIRDAAMSSTRAKLGGALLRPALQGLRAQIDPEAQGGAYLLGLRRLGVVPHGGFARRGFAQAILRARRGAHEDLIGRTHTALEQAGALRRAPVSARIASLPDNDAY